MLPKNQIILMEISTGRSIIKLIQEVNLQTDSLKYIIKSVGNFGTHLETTTYSEAIDKFRSTVETALLFSLVIQEPNPCKY